MLPGKLISVCPIRNLSIFGTSKGTAKPNPLMKVGWIDNTMSIEEALYISPSTHPLGGHHILFPWATEGSEGRHHNLSPYIQNIIVGERIEGTKSIDTGQKAELHSAVGCTSDYTTHCTTASCEEIAISYWICCSRPLKKYMVRPAMMTAFWW